MSITNYDLAREVVQKVGGDPNNAGIVKAVAIWLNYESGGNVTGNNPWNITGVGDCGTHKFSGNSLTFATYCSPSSGTTGTANLLKGNPAYRGIVAAIRAGDGLGFFTALFRSPWAEGGYASSRAGMLASWSSSFSNQTTLHFSNGSGGGVNAILTGAPGAGGKGSLGGGPTYQFPTGPDTIGAWYIGGNPTISFQKDYQLQQADVERIIAALDHAGWFNSGNPIASAQAINTFRGNMQPFVGQPWNAATILKMQVALGGAAAEAGSGPATLAQAFKVLHALTDTDNLRYGFAIIIGVPLALFGFYLLAGVKTGDEGVTA